MTSTAAPLTRRRDRARELPKYHSHLDRAHKDPEVDPLSFRLLYCYVAQGRVSAVDDLSARLGVGRDRARKAQANLERLGYIVRTTTSAPGVKFTTLSFAAEPGTQWADFVAVAPVSEDAEGVVTAAETILSEEILTVTDYAETSPRDDKGRYAKPLVAPTTARSGPRLSCWADKLLANSPYKYLSGTYKSRQRDVDLEMNPLPPKGQPMYHLPPSDDFDSPASGSDFGDDFSGPLAKVHAPEQGKHRGRGPVKTFTVRKPWDDRDSKDPAKWNGNDLAAEFGCLVRRHCPEMYDANNFAKVRGALGRKIRQNGADPAELKQIMVMFFTDPRNLGDSPYPVWQRFLASLAAYQAPARKILGKESAAGVAAKRMSATPDDDAKAINQRSIARLRSLGAIQ